MKMALSAALSARASLGRRSGFLARHCWGLLPIAPAASLGHVEDFLHMLGLPEQATRARALDAYWITVSDHGLNASTFAARLVASTGSDVVPCILAALGA